MKPFLRIARRLLIRPLLEQDGFAVEAEQQAYDVHFDAPMIEVNPVVGQFQQLAIRKWEEFLAGQAVSGQESDVRSQACTPVPAWEQEGLAAT
jgi:hypothetical protein